MNTSHALIHLSSRPVRRAALGAVFFLPGKTRRRLDRWSRGLHEYHKLRAADAVIASFPKSGRTWLRAMLSRFYQRLAGLEEMGLIGFHGLRAPGIPRVLFTDDNYVADYTGRSADKSVYYDRRVVLLVRDPRDVAVSSYFQRRYRPNPRKDGLRDLDVEEGSSMFEFVEAHMRHIVDWQNLWFRELDRVRAGLLVRYEDLRGETPDQLARIVRFLGAEPEPAWVQEAVDFARFDNLKRLEADRAFGANDRRFQAGDVANPDSYKVRRGVVGGYRDYFDDEQVERLDRLVREKLETGLGYA